MMVQMFGTMHRDQMAVIREELDRLRDLTEEFHALKGELASRMHKPDATGSSGSAVAPAKPNRAVRPTTECFGTNSCIRQVE